MKLLRYHDDQPALITEQGNMITYAQLHERLIVTQKIFGDESSKKGLVFLFTRNTVQSITAYLAAFESQQAVALLDQQLKPEFAARLVNVYQPEWIYLEGDSEWLNAQYNFVESGFWLRRQLADRHIHSDLAILLTTSGSTGSPKFVRLSYENVLSNAQAIAQSLQLTRDERALTTLPFHYSYGMSILNSHLVSGACVVISEASVMEQGFWDTLVREKVTSLAGVPYTYQMLDRLGFAGKELPALRNLTQAGGKLPENLIRKFLDLAQQRKMNFFVMYGQTEASPRISCVPPERLADKVGSAGLPLTGGELIIETPEGRTTEPRVTGEIIYRGPNVMLGYAEDRNDLTLGDVQGHELYTGDLGYLDEEGFLFITGRSKRIAKVFGVRLNLDEVESLFKSFGAVAVLGGVDKLHIYHECQDQALVASTRKQVALDLKVPMQSLSLHPLERLPTLSSGKVDYRTLQRELDGGVK